MQTPKSPQTYRPNAQARFVRPERLEGRVTSVLPDGRLAVAFNQPVRYGTTGLFELCRPSGSAMLTAGVGELQVRGPGQAFVVPGPQGFSHPKAGDVVRAYGG